MPPFASASRRFDAVHAAFRHNHRQDQEKMSASAERATRARTQHSRPQSTGVRIAALAVSDSDTVLTQDEVLDRLRLKGNEFAERIFARCGVRERHLDLGD